MAEYKWNTANYRFYSTGIDPNEAGQELERLSEKGPLTPDRIIDSAKSRCSPLHTGFEWDDSKASHEWRRQQARGLLQTLRIVEREDESEPVRAFFHVVDERGNNVYVTREKAKTTEDYHLQVIRNALRLLEQAQSRLADIEGMEREIKAVARVIKSVEARRDKVKAEPAAQPPLNHII